MRRSRSEVVVRFPKAVKDGTYLFTVARGNDDHERGTFYVTKVTAGATGEGTAGAEGRLVRPVCRERQVRLGRKVRLVQQESVTLRNNTGRVAQ